ncbi:MAG: hypothetical protein ACJ8IQ_02720 [Chthoniobacterales bacterium]
MEKSAPFRVTEFLRDRASDHVTLSPMEFLLVIIAVLAVAIARLMVTEWKISRNERIRARHRDARG